MVWLDFDPTRGSEQAGFRPALIVSSDDYLRVIPRLVVVAPITQTDRGLPHHIALEPTEPGNIRGFVMTEQLRTIDKVRIKKRAGFLSQAQLDQVQTWLKLWI